MPNRIEIHPDVCNGRPVIKNTRITVSSILGFLSAGDSIEEVLQSFPTLKREDILACIAYAQRATESRSTYCLTA